MSITQFHVNIDVWQPFVSAWHDQPCPARRPLPAAPPGPS